MFQYLYIDGIAGKIAIFAGVSVVIIFTSILYLLSFAKLKKIRSRDLRRAKAEHDTYSIYSIYIIRWIQVQLVLIVLLAIATLIILSLD